MEHNNNTNNKLNSFLACATNRDSFALKKFQISIQKNIFEKIIGKHIWENFRNFPQIRSNTSDKHSASKYAAATHCIATFCATGSLIFRWIFLVVMILLIWHLSGFKMFRFRISFYYIKLQQYLLLFYTNNIMQIDYHQGNDNKYHNNCIYGTKKYDLFPHLSVTSAACDRIEAILDCPTILNLFWKLGIVSQQIIWIC